MHCYFWVRVICTFNPERGFNFAILSSLCLWLQLSTNRERLIWQACGWIWDKNYSAHFVSRYLIPTPTLIERSWNDLLILMYSPLSWLILGNTYYPWYILHEVLISGFAQNPISKDASERDALALLWFLYFMSSCGKWGWSYGMTNTARQYRPIDVKKADFIYKIIR